MNNKFYTAKDAYTRAKNINESLDEKLLEKVAQTINAAVLYGKYSVVLTINTIRECEGLRALLGNLGYTIKIETPYDQRDHFYNVTISWADAQ